MRYGRKHGACRGMHRRTDVSSVAILCQTARGCLHRPACSLGYSACRAIQGNGRQFCNPTLISTLPKLSALDVMVCMRILPFCADVGHAYRQESPSLTTLRTVSWTVLGNRFTPAFTAFRGY